MRDERCRACGRPTSAGEDFGGPCVYDSDLECALATVEAVRRLIPAGTYTCEWRYYEEIQRLTEQRDTARRELGYLRERMIEEADDHERWHNHLAASTLRRLAKGEL